MSDDSGAKMKHENRSGLARTLRPFLPGAPHLLVSALAGAFAQDAVEGIDNGNYHYQGSFELGYRFVNTNGSPTIYDTFVNQQQGPRLLDQNLNMRSLNHQGGLFDDLFVSSFGWGGDPENAGRMRLSKNKLYNFSVSFRRDRNFFDYNNLANPLNLANAYVQVNNSPHEFETVRRMDDYNLTLLPQSRVRIRLGFTRNNTLGPAFSTSFDLELFSADNAPTRISPRNLQHYKGRATYKPRPWLDISGTVNVLESRDNVPEVLHREHNRNYGFTTILTPRPRFGFEFGYNYDDLYSTTNICYVLTATIPTNSTQCSAGVPYFSAVSLYTNKVQFGYANIMFKPAPRVTANVGYNLTSTTGFTPTLADPTILTSLGFNYHKPTAELNVNLVKGLAWKTA